MSAPAMSELKLLASRSPMLEFAQWCLDAAADATVASSADYETEVRRAEACGRVQAYEEIVRALPELDDLAAVKRHCIVEGARGRVFPRDEHQRAGIRSGYARAASKAIELMKRVPRG